MLAEHLLHRMQRAVGRGQALDRGHRGAVGLHRQHGAGLHRLAVDMHDAGAALAGVAADMGAGQPQLLAQQLDQQRAALDLDRVLLAVHRQGHLRHPHPSLVARVSDVVTRSLVAGRLERSAEAPSVWANRP